MASEELLADLRRDEGLRLKSYPDPLSPLGKAMNMPASQRPPGWAHLRGDPWTIGFGHTGLDVSPNTVWTKAMADAALARDVDRHTAELNRRLPWWARLDDVRRDVLANMAFNLGVDGLLDFKNTLARVKAGDFEGAAEGMLKSLWARQVGERARRLAAMMRTGERA